MRVPGDRAAAASWSVLVEVGPNTDGDDDADAAECNPGPSGPSAPQAAIGGADVLQSLPPDPDGWDAGQDTEDQAQQPEGECVPGTSVDRVRSTSSVRVGVHPGVGPGGRSRNGPVFGLPGRMVTHAPLRYRLSRTIRPVRRSRRSSAATRRRPRRNRSLIGMSGTESGFAERSPPLLCSA
jgi:hypothetical protein